MLPLPRCSLLKPKPVAVSPMNRRAFLASQCWVARTHLSFLAVVLLLQGFRLRNFVGSPPCCLQCQITAVGLYFITIASCGLCFAKDSIGSD